MGICSGSNSTSSFIELYHDEMEDENMRYRDVFKNKKAIIAMLHLKGSDANDRFERAKKEIGIYYDNGIDAVLVENYFGSGEDCTRALEYLQLKYSGRIYGVNILGDYPKAFELADSFGAKFIQIDSVCGHLPPNEDISYAKSLEMHRKRSNVALLGGVRFKYQPVLSGRSLENDLTLGMERCDAIVVTGEGTGIPTPDGKIIEFREIVKDFPLIVGAGVTVDTCTTSLKLADGLIVGSWLKDQHIAHGDVNEDYVRGFVRCAQE